MRTSYKRFFSTGVLLFAVLSVFASGPRRAVVQSRLTGLREGAKVKLWDEMSDRCIDSTYVAGGAFSFDVDASQVTLCSIKGAGISRQFVLEPGELLLEGSPRDFVKGASGTELNARFSRFLSFYSQLYDSEKPSYVRRVVKYNKDNILSVVVLKFAPCITSYEAVRLIDSVDEPIRSLPYTQRYRELRSRLMRVEPYRAGAKVKPYYYDFTLPDASGRSISLKSMVDDKSHRYILIDFWATWCPSCLKEIPYMTKAYDWYKDRGLEILCVSWDRAADTAKWKQYVKDHGMVWANVIDVAGAKSKVSRDYVVDALPVNVLIDCSTGMIIGRNLRGEDLLNALRPLQFGKRK